MEPEVELFLEANANMDNNILIQSNRTDLGKGIALELCSMNEMSFKIFG
jgi:hypothetical protein